MSCARARSSRAMPPPSSTTWPGSRPRPGASSTVACAWATSRSAPPGSWRSSLRRVTAAASAPTYPDHLRLQVEAYLSELRFAKAEHAVAGLEEAMRYSLLAGGKRIRPVLALATAQATALPVSVMPIAAALELIHTYSLIHDDLPAMDDDDLRRGRPTCHRVYGEDVAILAGDGLYAEAFRHVLAHQEGDPRAILAAVCELAAATGVDGMVGGQFIDIKELATDGTTSLRKLHELKTGRLIGASVECVLLLAGDMDPSPRLK